MAPRQYSDYQISIFCALNRERIAVEAMLDERYKPLPNAIDDNNNYTYGRIGEHNVVITSPGVGNHGQKGALRATAYFKKLKFRFVVGIAATLPGDGQTKDRDIRLGDIVLGIRKDKKPYVVDYMAGRTLSTGFQIESSRYPPPQELLSTLDALEGRHFLEGPTYLRHLQEMLNDTRYTDRNAEHCYSYPSTADHLFKAGTSHVGTETSCEACIAQPDALVHRNTRQNRSKAARLIQDDMRGPWVHSLDDGYLDYPTVHRGTVACADNLVRSAVERDEIYQRILDQEKVVSKCLEMEASGVLTSWESCLVIRGICDYADTHKNDVWQGFAAAIAAAFLKDLIRDLPVTAVQAASAINQDAELANMNRMSIVRAESSRPPQIASNRDVLLSKALNRLRTDRTLLNDNARQYHDFMTAEGLLLYHQIWDLLSHGSLSISLQQVMVGTAILQLPLGYLESFCERLAQPQSQLFDTSFIAILYMTHLEYLSIANRSRPEAHYDPEDIRHRRFALITYWVHCPNDCGLLWNYVASNNGFFKMGPNRDPKTASKCLLYRLYSARALAAKENKPKYQPMMSVKSYEQAKQMLDDCRTGWLKGL